MEKNLFSDFNDQEASYNKKIDELYEKIYSLLNDNNWKKCKEGSIYFFLNPVMWAVGQPVRFILENEKQFAVIIVEDAADDFVGFIESYINVIQTYQIEVKSLDEKLAKAINDYFYLQYKGIEEDDKVEKFVFITVEKKLLETLSCFLGAEEGVFMNGYYFGTTLFSINSLRSEHSDTWKVSFVHEPDDYTHKNKEIAKNTLLKAKKDITSIKQQFLEKILEQYNAEYEIFLNDLGLKEISYDEIIKNREYEYDDEYDDDDDDIENVNIYELEDKEIMRSGYLPRFSKPEQIEKFIMPETIYISCTEPYLFFLSYTSFWEEEHEYFVEFRDNKAVKVLTDYHQI